MFRETSTNIFSTTSYVTLKALGSPNPEYKGALCLINILLTNIKNERPIDLIISKPTFCQSFLRNAAVVKRDKNGAKILGIIKTTYKIIMVLQFKSVSQKDIPR